MYLTFAMSTLPWKQDLLQQLKARNEREQYPYHDLIIAYQKILSQVDSLRRQNLSLEYRNSQLQQEADEAWAKSVESGTTANSGDMAKANKKIKDLEHRLSEKESKIMEITNDLMENVKKNRDTMEKMNDLTKQLHSKEDQLKAINLKLIDEQNGSDILKAQKKSLEDAVREVERKHQLMKDEYEALQITCNSIEDRSKQLQKDNDQLRKMVMDMKSQQADALNQQNESIKKAREEKLKKEIEEASAAKVSLVQKTKKRVSSSMSSSEDGVPVVAPDVKLPSICPAVVISSLDAHDGEISACNFSRRGTYFATGGSDKLVKIWNCDATLGKCTAKNTLLGSNASIMSIEFDDLEKYVLAASNDYAARLWAVSEQKARQTLTGHGNKVLCAKFLEDSKVVTGSHDRTLKIWDLRYKTCSKTLFAGSSCNDVVAGKGLGHVVISGHFDKKIRFWDIQSGSANEITLAGRITSLDLSPGCYYVAHGMIL